MTPGTLLAWHRRLVTKHWTYQKTGTAQAVFVGIGAYVTTLVGPHVDGSLIVCALAGIGLSIVAALVLASTALRVSDAYFMVASLAFQIMVSTMFTSWYSMTKGTDGIAGIPYPRVFGFELSTPDARSRLVWAVAALVVILTAVLRRGSSYAVAFPRRRRNGPLCPRRGSAGRTHAGR